MLVILLVVILYMCYTNAVYYFEYPKKQLKAEETTKDNQRFILGLLRVLPGHPRKVHIFDLALGAL